MFKMRTPGKFMTPHAQREAFMSEWSNQDDLRLLNREQLANFFWNAAIQWILSELQKPEMVERVARALFDAPLSNNPEGDGPYIISFEEYGEICREIHGGFNMYFSDAQAAINEIVKGFHD